MRGSSSSSADARVFFVSRPAQYRHPNTGKESSTTTRRLAISRRSGISVRDFPRFQAGTYSTYPPGTSVQGKRVDLIPHRARPWPRERSTPRPDLPQSPPPTRIPAIQLWAEPGTTTDLFPSVEGAVFFFVFSRHVANACMHASIHWRQPPFQCEAGLGHNATAQKLCCVRRQCTIRSLSLCRTGPYPSPRLVSARQKLRLWNRRLTSP